MLNKLMPYNTYVLARYWLEIHNVCYSMMSRQNGFSILDDELKEFSLEKDVKTSVKVSCC